MLQIGKPGVMLHIGAGHSKKCQIILKVFGRNMLCNNLEHKNNFKQIWRYQRYSSFMLQIVECYGDVTDMGGS